MELYLRKESDFISMANKKAIDIKLLSKEIESLIEIKGNSRGQKIIIELIRRMEKTKETIKKDDD